MSRTFGVFLTLLNVRITIDTRVSLIHYTCILQRSSMSKRTVLNEPYRGLVENFSIPAELHERPDGHRYATFGSVIPIHCTPPEEVSIDDFVTSFVISNITSTRLICFFFICLPLLAGTLCNQVQVHTCEIIFNHTAHLHSRDAQLFGLNLFLGS